MSTKIGRGQNPILQSPKPRKNVEGQKLENTIDGACPIGADEAVSDSFDACFEATSLEASNTNNLETQRVQKQAMPSRIPDALHDALTDKSTTKLESVVLKSELSTSVWDERIDYALSPLSGEEASSKVYFNKLCDANQVGILLATDEGRDQLAVSLVELRLNDVSQYEEVSLFIATSFTSTELLQVVGEIDVHSFQLLSLDTVRDVVVLSEFTPKIFFPILESRLLELGVPRELTSQVVDEGLIALGEEGIEGWMNALGPVFDRQRVFDAWMNVWTDIVERENDAHAHNDAREIVLTHTLALGERSELRGLYRGDPSRFDALARIVESLAEGGIEESLANLAKHMDAEPHLRNVLSELVARRFEGDIFDAIASKRHSPDLESVLQWLESSPNKISCFQRVFDQVLLTTTDATLRARLLELAKHSSPDEQNALYRTIVLGDETLPDSCLEGLGPLLDTYLLRQDGIVDVDLLRSTYSNHNFLVTYHIYRRDDFALDLARSLAGYDDNIETWTKSEGLDEHQETSISTFLAGLSRIRRVGKKQGFGEDAINRLLQLYWDSEICDVPETDMLDHGLSVFGDYEGLDLKKAYFADVWTNRVLDDGDLDSVANALDANIMLMSKMLTRAGNREWLGANYPEELTRYETLKAELAEIGIVDYDIIPFKNEPEKILEGWKAQKDERPVAIVIQSPEDWNLGFYHGIAEHYPKLYESHRVLFAHARGEEDVANIGARAHGFLGESSIDVLVLAGHGSQNMISFGAKDPRFSGDKAGLAHLDSDDDSLLEASFAKLLNADSDIVLYACSNGAEKESQSNLAKVVASCVGQSRVHALPDPNNASFTFDEHGRFRGLKLANTNEGQVPVVIEPDALIR